MFVSAVSALRWTSYIRPAWGNSCTALGTTPRPCAPLPDVRGIEVTTASPAYLLAMKLMAMRFGEDEEDIELLIRECGITNASDALALLAKLYPHQKPPLKTRLFLEELLGPITHRERGER
jgi:hypothetical protein